MSTMSGSTTPNQQQQQVRKKYTITAPGIVYCIASRYGLSFAYTVYLAYLYVESRDPVYALKIAGGNAAVAKDMLDGKVEYPYGIAYHPNADKKFEPVNRFVLCKPAPACDGGSLLYVDGIVTDIARHELSRRDIVRCVPRSGTVMFTNERYREMQAKDADMRAIVA